jgi:hypothetical protein
MRGEIAVGRADLVAQFPEQGRIDRRKIGDDAEPDSTVDDVVEPVVIERTCVAHF